MTLRRFQLVAACCLAIIMAGACSEALAGKPKPPPPPPPPNPFLIYQWRPDLGGWLDTQTNLVWGYSFQTMLGTSTHSGYGINQSMAVAAAGDYADILYEVADVDLPNAAAETTAHADWQVEQGDIALANGDPELAAEWYEAADANYALAQDDLDSIPLYEAAADVADQFNWRLPTKVESQRAQTNGLFTYGPTGFDSYDGSPRIDFQMPWNTLCWTSTKTSNGRNAWAYRPLDGTGGNIGVNSQVNAIFVRTHVP
jgi:hypothetical protein